MQQNLTQSNTVDPEQRAWERFLAHPPEVARGCRKTVPCAAEELLPTNRHWEGGGSERDACIIGMNGTSVLRTSKATT